MYDIFSIFSQDVVEMSKHCIVHYSGCDSYSKIKDVSEINHQRLRETKALREQLKDDHYHKVQYKSIPNLIDNSIHGIHLGPCYQKIHPYF